MFSQPCADCRSGKASTALQSQEFTNNRSRVFLGTKTYLARPRGLVGHHARGLGASLLGANSANPIVVSYSKGTDCW